MDICMHNNNATNYSEEEQFAREDAWLLEEEKYVSNFYIALIILLSIGQLIEPLFGTTIARLLELLSLVTMVISFLRLKRQGSLIKFQGWSRALCLMVSLCLLQVFLRGSWSELGLKDLGLYIINTTFSLPYIVSLCILFLPNTYHIDRISNIFFWGTLLVVPIWLINLDNLVQDLWRGESVGAYLPFLACFLLSYPNSLSRRRKIIMWIIWGIYLALMILNARRNMIFSLSVYAAIAYYIRIGRHMNSAFKRIIFNGLTLSIVVLPLLLNFSTSSNANLKRLNNRITEDTRSSVELFFLADYYTYTQAEQAFGKGAYGTYFQYTWNKEIGKMGEERFVVETGYLNMMLKGGYILMFIIILFLLTCLIKALWAEGPEGIYFRFAFIYFIVACYATDLVCICTFQSVVFWLSVNLLLTHQPLCEEYGPCEENIESQLIS